MSHVIRSFFDETSLITVPSVTTLTAPLGILDNIIEVVSTDGYPNDSSYVIVNDEIIFYYSKTSTEFQGCQRGHFGTTPGTGIIGDRVESVTFLTQLQNGTLNFVNGTHGAIINYDSNSKVSIRNEWEELVKIEGDLTTGQVESRIPIKYDQDPSLMPGFDGNTVVTKDWVENQLSGATIVTYTHVQSIAVDTWLITHGLGQYPSVTVVDSGGTVVIGDVVYLSANHIAIYFSAPFGGKAYLN